MSENDYQIVIPLKEYKKLVEKAQGAQTKETSKKTTKEPEPSQTVNTQENRRFTTIVVLLILSLLFSLTALTVSLSNFKGGVNPQTAEHQNQAVITKKYDRGQSLEKAMKKDKPLLILFYANWCGFCQRFAPTFSKIAKDKQIKSNFAVAWVDVDAPENAQYAQDYQITAFPTVYVVDKEGKRTQLDNNTFFNENSKEVVKNRALELIGANK